MVVNKMGPPSRMLIRWVCPNQQMATFQTRETTNGTTRYLNHINKFADQQDGPTTHIVVSGPISFSVVPKTQNGVRQLYRQPPHLDPLLGPSR